ncbi:hypothetical protein Tco_0304716 [Tanacetum coccineum]
MIRVGNMVYFQDYEWIYHILDYELMLKLEEYWWGKKGEEELSEDAWSNYLPNEEWEHREDTTYIKSDVNSNHDTYNNVFQMFKNREGINMITAPAGRLYVWYVIGVATLRVLVHAGDKTSEDARPQLVDTDTESDPEEAPSEAEESHPLGSRVPLMSEEFEASKPSGTRTVHPILLFQFDSTTPLSP